MTNPKFYFTPFFIIRFYLLQDIKKILVKYKFTGNLLDVGCGEKPYQNLFKNVSSYTGIDFNHYSKHSRSAIGHPDIYFPNDYNEKLALPFIDNSFQNTVSFQVFEHHKNPQKMFSEMFRVLKNGGYMLISAPFLGGIHEEPNDYQRFTKYGLIELLKPYKCEILEIKEQGALFSTISMLLNEYLNSFAVKNKLFYFISVLIYLPFLLLSYVSLLLDKIFKSNKIFLNYLILVKKNY